MSADPWDGSQRNSEERSKLKVVQSNVDGIGAREKEIRGFLNSLEPDVAVMHGMKSRKHLEAHAFSHGNS